MYNDALVRQFLWASVLWGSIAMVAGALLALQLAHPTAALDPRLAYGRLRPLHANLVVQAFVGNAVFAGVYYSIQRVLRTRLASDWLGRMHFGLWQLAAAATALTLPLGISQGRSYGEAEWFVDLAIIGAWLLFAGNLLWTIARRREPRAYISIWFYIAAVVLYGVRFVAGNLAVPYDGLHSYSALGGTQDALAQSWGGQGAAEILLALPLMGLVYYFVPRATQQPVYSYRLAVLHFWALVLAYTWSGPQYLLDTPAPEWLQTLGLISGVLALAGSWGGVFNGLQILRSAWSRVREDPVLRFFTAGLVAFGVHALQSVMLSLREPAAAMRFTDATMAHADLLAMGWAGLIIAGVFYWLVPRLYDRPLHSRPLAGLHFYFAVVGTLLYIVASWTSGGTQAALWRSVTAAGELEHPTFLESLLAIRPLYGMRAIGSGLYLLGFLWMPYNLLRTALAGRRLESPVDDGGRTALSAAHWRRVALGRPVLIVATTVGLLAGTVLVEEVAATTLAALAVAAAVGGAIVCTLGRTRGETGWHEQLERHPLLFAAFAAASAVAGFCTVVLPAIAAHRHGSPESASADLYTPLEVEGRDIYIREGCQTCHSQMVLPYRHELLRYGDPSPASLSRHHHPALWGSLRNGPDLAREGGRYPDIWHLRHLLDPRSISPHSTMPAYRSLADDSVVFEHTTDKLRGLKAVGVPYSAAMIEHAAVDARRQADRVTAELARDGAVVPADREIVALIAYLQRLGNAPGAEASVSR